MMIQHEMHDAMAPRPMITAGRVVVVDLEAAEMSWELEPGRTVRGWGYNGQVPGPVIDARVGDTLVVRLTNRLPEPTTIHWHGLRLPSPRDGTEDAQRPVQPGETFEYRFVLPDAGTFWYHPHFNETVQMERGLYGVLIVRDDAEPVLDRERVLVLDDLTLDRRGRIASPGGMIERHNGREGNVRLLNGLVEPELAISGGHLERWRVLNAASARYVRLSIGGRPFRIIGSDGGLLETPVEAREVLLAPSDRVELVVGPFETGDTVVIESLPYDRGLGKGDAERFATLRVGPAAPSRAQLPATLRPIVPLTSGPMLPTRTVRLGGRMSLRRGVDFLVNGERHHHDRAVEVGSLEVWDVINETAIDHPFHLHGFFFQVLDVNGEAPAVLAWEDTINVPRKGRVRIAWRADDRPGRWMYHCHILEHHAAGMMGHFDVIRPGDPVPAGGSACDADH